MEIQIKGIDIKQDGELINLTDIWKASGLGEKKRPNHWKDHVGDSFIKEVSLNTEYPAFKTVRGKQGGTFAHWQIALAYASWLSPELHKEINKTYMRAKAGDVTLADEIADKASPEQQKWLKKRLDGKVARLEFTATLKEHGVKGYGYGVCSDQINLGIIGQTSREFREERGIKKSEVRDNMSHEQLAALELAEMVAARKIKEEDIHGNAKCAKKCGDIAHGIKEAIR